MIHKPEITEREVQIIERMRLGVEALDIAVDALSTISVSPTSAGDVAMDALRRIKGAMSDD